MDVKSRVFVIVRLGVSVSDAESVAVWVKLTVSDGVGERVMD